MKTFLKGRIFMYALLTFTFILSTFQCFSQGVAINISGNAAENSAILDIQPDTSLNTTSQGMLMPRMSTLKRPVNPANGLIIYNTDCLNFQYYDGTQWINLNINPNNSIGTPGLITGSSLVCANQSGVTYSISAVSGATSYGWTIPNGASITYSSSPANNITLTFGSNAGNVCVSASNNCITSSTSCKTVSINQPPDITDQPVSPAAVCAGTGTPSFTVTATGTGLTYQWQEYISSWIDVSNSVVYSGATGATLTITNPTAVMNAYKYRCVVSGDCTPIATSNGLATLTVNNAPSAPTAGNNGPVCVGSALSLNASTISGATYSWTGPAGFTSSVQNPTVSSSATTGMSGTYSATATVNGCVSNAGTTNATVSSSFSGSQTFNANGSSINTGSVQTFTVPCGVTSITIEAYGGEGGAGTTSGSTSGKGAYIIGTFSGLTPGNVLNILVGKQGESGANTGGGGGGSFVWNASNALLIAAAGGGGGGYATTGGAGSSTSTPSTGGGSPGSAAGGTGGSGGGGGSVGSGACNQGGAGGGAGWSGNGTNGVTAGCPNPLPPGGGGSYPLDAATGVGGTAGTSSAGTGGYGGGGGSGNGSGGGGGGYNGGGGGNGHNYTSWAGGGGGGSYNGGTSQTNSSGVQSGNGKVVITY